MHVCEYVCVVSVCRCVRAFVHVYNLGSGSEKPKT